MALGKVQALSVTHELVSFEPATGAEMWRAPHGDVDQLVEQSKRAWPAWAAQPLAVRIELVRRFVNEVRKDQEELAELIARETGKPLWEARTEVEAVMAKVDISVNAYAERTGQRKLNSALQGTAALRHKPHGVMAVLGPYNFPAHLPNGHMVPALIAGNTAGVVVNMTAAGLSGLTKRGIKIHAASILISAHVFTAGAIGVRNNT